MLAGLLTSYSVNWWLLLRHKDGKTVKQCCGADGRQHGSLRRSGRIDLYPTRVYALFMAPANESKTKVRIKRIAGQVAGVQRMIEEERYCVDILNQISAVRSALDALGVELLANHLESCVIGHGAGSEHARAKPMKTAELLSEVRVAIARFLK
jgi:DNA-binding FrmR family transcriptional regulator